MLDMDVFLVCLSTTDHRKHACVCVCVVQVYLICSRGREKITKVSQPLVHFLNIVMAVASGSEEPRIPQKSAVWWQEPRGLHHADCPPGLPWRQVDQQEEQDLRARCPTKCLTSRPSHDRI